MAVILLISRFFFFVFCSSRSQQSCESKGPLTHCREKAIMNACGFLGFCVRCDASPPDISLIKLSHRWLTNIMEPKRFSGFCRRASCYKFSKKTFALVGSFTATRNLTNWMESDSSFHEMKLKKTWREMFMAALQCGIRILLVSRSSINKSSSDVSQSSARGSMKCKSELD